MSKRITFAHRDAAVQMFDMDTFIALLPVIAVAVLQNGMRGIVLILTAALSGIVTDAAFLLIGRKRGLRLYPLSAGLVFAFICPLSVPVWLVALGAALAAAMWNFLDLFGKSYFINPSAFSWLFFLTAAPKIMSAFPEVSSVQSLPAFADLTGLPGTESILYQLKTGFLPNNSIGELLTGQVAGGFGAAAVGAAAVSLLYLLIRKAAAYEVTFSLLLTVLLFTIIFNRISAPVYLLYLLQLSGGSLLFAAVFMASGTGAPQTTLLRVCCGVGSGLLIMVLRLFNFDEFSVPFALIVCQAVCNLLDRKFFVFCVQRSTRPE